MVAATTKKAGLNETVQQFLSHDSVTGDPTSAVLDVLVGRLERPSCARDCERLGRRVQGRRRSQRQEFFECRPRPARQDQEEPGTGTGEAAGQGPWTQAQAQGRLLARTADKIQIKPGAPAGGSRQPAGERCKHLHQGAAPHRRAISPRDWGYGLILALVIVGVIEALDTRVRRSEEVGEVLGLPLLSRYPDAAPEPEGPAGDDRRRRPALQRGVPEAARQSRLREHQAGGQEDPGHERAGTGGQVDNGRQPGGCDGRAGRHVVLVDLDLRPPRCTRSSAWAGRPG